MSDSRPNTGLTIRTATVADVSLTIKFWSEAAENDHRSPDSAGAVERLLHRAPEALLIAVEGERIVGSVIADWDGWRCHLYRLAVAADKRRRGVARALIERAEARFQHHGGRRSIALVLSENTRGQQLWTALVVSGFGDIVCGITGAINDFGNGLNNLLTGGGYL